jgi:RNA polymerase sigma-70 factor (ECF subfamily)
MGEFSKLITENQQKLYGYIFSLLGDSSATWDVLQETNIVLLRKKGEFRKGSNFTAWAFATARFQTLAYLRDRSREPVTLLTPDLIELFAEDSEAEATQFDIRLSALGKCITRLPEKSRSLVDLHYNQRMAMKEIADSLNQTPNAIKQAIFRIRRALQDCIEASAPSPPPRPE